MTIPSITGKPPHNSALPSKSEKIETLQSTDKTTPAGSESTVSVDITQIAKEITKAFETSPDEAPAIDRSRVNEIRTALSEGTYFINAELIAEKIIEEQEHFYDTR